MENANNKPIEATNPAESSSHRGNNPNSNMFQWLFPEDSSDALVDTTAEMLGVYKPEDDCTNEELITAPATNEPCVGEDLLETNDENDQDLITVQSTNEPCVDEDLLETNDENDQDLITVQSTNEPCVGEDLLETNDQESITEQAEPCMSEDVLADVEHGYWEPIDGVWNWIDPTGSDGLNLDSEDDAQTQILPLEEKTPQVTFLPLVAVVSNETVRFEDLSYIYHGDIRSQSEITDVDSLHSLYSNPSFTSSTSSKPFVCQCAPVQTCDKATSIDSWKDFDKKPDLIALINDLAAKIKELREDIDAMVREFGSLTISAEEPMLDTTGQAVRTFPSSATVSSVDNDTKEATEDKCCDHDDDDGYNASDEC